jgi:hypothetical protein
MTTERFMSFSPDFIDQSIRLIEDYNKDTAIQAVHAEMDLKPRDFQMAAGCWAKQPTVDPPGLWMALPAGSGKTFTLQYLESIFDGPVCYGSTLRQHGVRDPTKVLFVIDEYLVDDVKDIADKLKQMCKIGRVVVASQQAPPESLQQLFQVMDQEVVDRITLHAAHGELPLKFADGSAFDIRNIDECKREKQSVYGVKPSAGLMAIGCWTVGSNKEYKTGLWLTCPEAFGKIRIRDYLYEIYDDGKSMFMSGEFLKQFNVSKIRDPSERLFVVDSVDEEHADILKEMVAAGIRVIVISQQSPPDSIQKLFQVVDEALVHRIDSMYAAYEREQQKHVDEDVPRCGADDCPGADECSDCNELVNGPDPEDVMWRDVEPQIADVWMKEQEQIKAGDVDDTDDEYMPFHPDTTREMVEAKRAHSKA